MVEASRFLIADRFRFERAPRALFRVEGEGAANLVPLGSRAADLLLLFLRRPGELVSKNEIMDEVWPNTAVEDGNLRVQISALRQALDAEGDGASAIATVPGRGYRFTLPVRPEQEPDSASSPGPAVVPILRSETAQPGRRNAIGRRAILAIACAALLIVAGAVLVGWHLSRAPSANVADATGAGRPFDPGSVPLLTDRARSSLVDYTQQPNFKAIAISRTGWGVSTGFADTLAAERDAVDRCKKRDPVGDCRIYAVGDTVVWPQLPFSADVHLKPLDSPLQPGDLALVRGMPSVTALNGYVSGNGHKAFAVSSDGAYVPIMDRPDQAEAIRLAFERCSDFVKSACLLMAADGFWAARIPRTHGMVRPYTLAGESEMSDADRARIADIYRGDDWRALAKGGSGRWYAVNAAPSEDVAADRALQDCRRVEQDCALRAIGNFRVEAGPP
jgi:DNA-binding winged helix-turn-helix (wHTH) protein